MSVRIEVWPKSYRHALLYQCARWWWLEAKVKGRGGQQHSNGTCSSHGPHALLRHFLQVTDCQGTDLCSHLETENDYRNYNHQELWIRYHFLVVATKVMVKNFNIYSQNIHQMIYRTVSTCSPSCSTCKNQRETVSPDAHVISGNINDTTVNISADIILINPVATTMLPYSSIYQVRPFLCFVHELSPHYTLQAWSSYTYHHKKFSQNCSQGNWCCTYSSLCF